MLYEYAVVVGRFQPFHKGHTYLIDRALDLADKVIVLVGSSFGARSPKNPFTFEERAGMIRLVMGEASSRVHIVGVRDHHDDSMWATDVANKVGLSSDYSSSVVLVGHCKDASGYYLSLFPEWDYSEQEPYRDEEGNVISASDVRDWMFAEGSFRPKIPKPLTASCFPYMFVQSIRHVQLQLREEYKYLKEYPKQWGSGPFITVDPVVFHRGHVLVVTRGRVPGKGLLALPGGFMDLGERLLDGALRELKEETGLVIDASTLVDQHVFDSPYRSLRGRTITHAFNFVLDRATEKLPNVQGADDASEAFWMPIRECSSELFFDDHHDIITYFATRDTTR